jgi:hypothetical protein
MKKFLYWAPRILSIAMVAFISIFAFDVFSEGNTGWKLVLALVMHLLPTIVAVIIIIIAWKWEQIGGWFFIALGIGLAFIGGFKLATLLLIALPFAIAGAMYLSHHYKYIKGKEL